MFYDLIKYLLKILDLNLKDSQASLLQDIDQNKFVVYLFIGGFAVSIDVGTFLSLHELIGIKALISHSISVSISAIFSFLANAYLNFKKTDFLFYRLGSFSIVIGMGYLLGVLIIFIIDNVLQFGGTIGKLASLPFVVLLQFYLNSKITFRATDG